MKFIMAIVALLFSYSIAVFATYIKKCLSLTEKPRFKDIKLKEYLVSVICPILAFIILCCSVQDLSAIISGRVLHLLLFVFISSALACLGVILSVIRAQRSSSLTVWISILLFAFLVSLMSEICVFNSRSLQSAYFESYDLTDQITSDKEKVSQVIFEIPNTQIENIYIKYENASHEKADIQFMFVDESNKLFTEPYTRAVYFNIPQSSYIPINLLGKSDSLRVIFPTSIEDLGISAISINTPRPFEVSVLRVISIMALCFFFMILKERTLKDEKLSLKSSKQLIIVFSCVLICSAVFAKLIIDNDFFATNTAYHHSQFQSLAKAFCRGELYLPDEVPEFILNMENPYDTAFRGQLAANNNQTYHWDAAYFGGHYYVYFGVVPTLLLYLPFYLLTGKDLPNGVAVLIFAILLIASVFFLIYALVRRFSKRSNISLGEYLLLSLTSVLGGGTVFLSCYPDLYSVPIISGLAFSALGLAFWLISYKFEENAPKRFTACLTLGSVFLALAVGCRPQFVLLSFLAIPIFWSSVFKKRTLISKKGFISTLLFALPYVIVAAGLMWYNFARFGSPFDFGASYNLTTNDVSNRGFVFDRIGTVIYYYLLQPYVIDPIYPFLRTSYIMTTYMGTTIRQDIYGGIIFQSPLVILLLGSYFVKDRMKKSGSFFITLSLVAIGFITVILDGQMGGILQRYVCDFALIFTLAAVIVYIALKDKIYKIGSGSRVAYSSLTVIFALTAVFAVLFTFTATPIDKVYQYLFWL